jgi:hypothetical protein
MKKIVSYECWQMDCQLNAFDGDNITERMEEHYKYIEED